MSAGLNIRVPIGSFNQMPEPAPPIELLIGPNPCNIFPLPDHAGPAATIEMTTEIAILLIILSISLQLRVNFHATGGADYGRTSSISSGLVLTFETTAPPI